MIDEAGTPIANRFLGDTSVALGKGEPHQATKAGNDPAKEGATK